MVTHPLKSPAAGLALAVLALALANCSSMPSFPSFSSPTEQPPPPGGGAAMPSKYQPEEVVGRWGFTSYHREQDRARTEAAARGQCKQPYVIARGPNGGVMMHLAPTAWPISVSPASFSSRAVPAARISSGRPVTRAWRKTARSFRSTAGC